MTTLERLGADHLRMVVTGFRDALRVHQESINRLNVYPVPDGDTGTNMALTLESVCAELDEAAPDMGATCKAISHGSLMGARGNSGVILSQILRGMAGGFSDHGEGVGGPELAAGLGAAAEAAYQAVMRPVEGTILTVVREAAAGAAAEVERGEVERGGVALVDVLDSARHAARAALDNTPEQLAVLKDAGVVDAGGAGFVLLLDAALAVVAGRPVPSPPAAVEAMAVVAADGLGGAPGGGDGAGSIAELRYEVMYFLEAPDEAVPSFKEVWAGIGDSIVVVGGDGTWNCHIHTDDIGASIEAALEVGRPRRIRVTDLLEQVEEERWVREGAVGGADDAAPVARDVTTAVVAVATGDGVRRIFRSLGVGSVVAGGQSMNPSTAQLLEAAEAAGADEVVILPNNKNIVPVAEQVDRLTDVTVRVVPTRGVVEGFAALLAYDPDAPVIENAKEMASAAEAVTVGEVTQAVRDSTCDAGPIVAGDWLGIARDGIVVVGQDLATAVVGLLGRLAEDDHEMVTFIEGVGATAVATRRATEWLAEHHPGVEVEIHHGGQPLYPYLLGLE